MFAGGLPGTVNPMFSGGNSGAGNDMERVCSAHIDVRWAPAHTDAADVRVWPVLCYRLPRILLFNVPAMVGPVYNVCYSLLVWKYHQSSSDRLPYRLRIAVQEDV